MSNVQNGKAFEYALAIEYLSFIRNLGLKAELVLNAPTVNARGYFEAFSLKERSQYLLASRSSIATIMKLESGFVSPKNAGDVLKIRIASDSEGIYGDVRDVIFSRPVSRWEVGFSAKNNNDDVKHSRLSSTIDFGDSWFGYSVSNNYWHDIEPVFRYLQEQKRNDKTWNQLGSDKQTKVYIPLLNAFKEEMMRLYQKHADVPQKLIMYLLGQQPFYKVIKDDVANMVIIKAFNINGGLNQTVNGKKPTYKTKEVYLPTRIVELDFKKNGDGSTSDNTLHMILDKGWEISFRLHNAATKVETSLKFAVQMLGNPPILFTQYIFQD